MPKRFSCLSPQSFRHSFNWCGFKLFLWPMVSIELFNNGIPHSLRKISHVPCHKDHTQHCSTYSIDVVSKWSCSHSCCFSWSNILHSNQAAAQKQEAAAGKQQAGTRGNQVPGSSRRRNDVKTTYKRRMKRRWNQTGKPMGEGKGKHPTSSTRQEFPMAPLDPNNNNANPLRRRW